MFEIICVLIGIYIISMIGGSKTTDKNSKIKKDSNLSSNSIVKNDELEQNLDKLLQKKDNLLSNQHLECFDSNIKRFKQFSNYENILPNIPLREKIKYLAFDFEQEPKLNLSVLENFDEADKFCEDLFLNKSKYYNFIHLTKLSNLPSIIANNGIYSKNYLTDKNVEIDFITNELSHQLDKRQNLDDYVHLSIIQDSPMFKKFLSKNENFALILISPLILYYRAFLISDKNATDNTVNIGKYSDIKNILDFNKLYTINGFPNYGTQEYKMAQAEVMIYKNIPLKFVSEIIPLICENTIKDEKRITQEYNEDDRTKTFIDEFLEYKLRDKKIFFEHLNSHQYQEVYKFKSNDLSVILKIFYNKDRTITNIDKHSGNNELFKDIVKFLNE